MRIDQTTSAATVRQLQLSDRTRLNSPEAGDAADTRQPPSQDATALALRSDGPPTASSNRLADTTALAEEPRFAMLIGLMERLTGREIKLVPPATLVLGARTKPLETHAPPPKPSDGAALHVSSVRPIDGGRSFRVGASNHEAGAARRSVQVDVDRAVVETQGGHRNEARPPLRLHVDTSAVQAPPTRPLRVSGAGHDAVRVSAPEHHVDVDA